MRSRLLVGAASIALAAGAVALAGPATAGDSKGCTMTPGADCRNHDMRGMDMRNKDMRGMDMSGADMRGVDMSGSDMTGANMDGANMSGAKMTGGSMKGASMKGAKMMDMTMTNVMMDKVTIVDTALTRSKFKKVSMKGAKVKNSAVNQVKFSDSDLSGAQLVGIYDGTPAPASGRAVSTRSASQCNTNQTSGITGGNSYSNVRLDGALINYACLGSTSFNGGSWKFARILNSFLSGTMSGQNSWFETAVIQGVSFFGMTFTGGIWAPRVVANSNFGDGGGSCNWQYASESIIGRDYNSNNTVSGNCIKSSTEN